LLKGNVIEKVVSYCVKKIKLLLNNNIKPILIFDGVSLEMKAETNNERRKIREESFR